MPAFSFTAPCVSAEDEKREQAELTAEEKECILDDLYGRRDASMQYENDDDVTSVRLREMDEVLKQIPPEERKAYARAMVECPELVERESSAVRFLRCEEYDPVKAARRLVRYWEMRLFVFEDRAFLPMTLAQAMGGRYSDLLANTNFYRILPSDSSRRTVIFCDRRDVNAQETFASNPMSEIRIAWYIMHVALEQETTQTEGIVLLILPIQTHNLNLFDRARTKLIFKSFSECLPIRIRAWHYCHPPVTARYLMPMVKFLSGRDWRMRMLIHEGSQEEVLETLLGYGFKREGIPTALGGDYPEYKSWVRERRIMEESLASPLSRMIRNSFYN